MTPGKEQTARPMKLEGTSWQPDWQRRAMDAEGEITRLREAIKSAFDEIHRGNPLLASNTLLACFEKAEK